MGLQHHAVVKTAGGVNHDTAAGLKQRNGYTSPQEQRLLRAVNDTICVATVYCSAPNPRDIKLVHGKPHAIASAFATA
jgi:hypothetical protein